MRTGSKQGVCALEKILTVPAAEKPGVAPVFVTGNHHVSLGEITQGGCISALSHISREGNCLVEYRGGRLFGPALGGVPLEADSAAYVHDFIPEFFQENELFSARWTYFAPEGIRGFCVRVQLRAKQAIQRELSLGFCPDGFFRSLFFSYPLEVDRHFATDSWTGCAVMELSRGFGVSAVALSGSTGFSARAGDGVLTVGFDLDMAMGNEKTLEFYIGIGSERDGACLANMDMRRRGADMFVKYAALLDRRHVSLPDPVLETRCNLNLNFCCYFSLGYPPDGKELVLITSKSSRYYVSGAYWARDSFLWAFPAVLRIDQLLAENMLFTGFTTYLEQGANHALYMNGANLYPGFELDQLVAPIIALGRYLSVTGEENFTRNDRVRRGAEWIAAELKKRRDPNCGLYGTELNPSDDPVGMPFLIYDNYLVLAALRVMNGRFGDFGAEIFSLENALSRHAAVETELGIIYAWAVDGKGGFEIYDDPPGSLLLLPYYGGESVDETVFDNTLRYFVSPQNPYFYSNGSVFGLGCEHATAPWPMSLCNLLLARGADTKVLNALRAMPMDNGLACETVRLSDGMLNTGAAFATFAGFYANAILEAFDNAD